MEGIAVNKMLSAKLQRIWLGELKNRSVKSILSEYGPQFFEELYTKDQKCSYIENYQDVITRINPFLLGLLKSREPIIIVAHPSILKCLHAYLAEKDTSSMVYQCSLPENT